MRKVLLVALVLAAGMVVPTSATAAPVRDCGMQASIHNVTSRNVSCLQARALARSYGFVPPGAGSHGFRGYWCQVRSASGFYEMDVRCTASRGRVIRWQYWSGE